mgnify:CR=1 FL=1
MYQLFVHGLQICASGGRNGFSREARKRVVFVSSQDAKAQGFSSRGLEEKGGGMKKRDAMNRDSFGNVYETR